MAKTKNTKASSAPVLVPVSAPSRAKATRPIADVAHPGTSAPSDTSKSIITPRPIMKDPMVVEEGIDKSEETAKKKLPAKTAEVKIAPPDETTPPDDSDSETPEAAETGAPAEDVDKPEPKPETEEAKETEEAAADEAAAQAAQDARLQKIIDDKKYFLPINAVEHRRTARFVALGILLALVLAVVWVDIALDAGLIHIGSAKAVTHFFSN